MNKVLITEEGFEALKAELEELKTVKREDISEKIRIARGFGDLSENSEYDQAKNDQALVEARIAQIEDQLKNIQILDADSLKGNVAQVGCKVTLLDLELDEEMTYRIVSAVEANSVQDAISEESPVGKAIIGHKAGQEVLVKVPAGEIKFKILSIAV